MQKFTKRVRNKIGLHLRAASEFVKIASQYDAEVMVYNGDKSANGKSILGLASLAAASGANIRVEVAGPDEADAAAALKKLFDDKFYED